MQIRNCKIHKPMVLGREHALTNYDLLRLITYLDLIEEHDYEGAAAVPDMSITSVLEIANPLGDMMKVCRVGCH